MRKPKKHNLKIYDDYAFAKFSGLKPFEIRDISDRDFRVGDTVVYTVIDRSGHKINHPLSKLVFEITFICNFMQRHNYVVFADRILE